MEARSKALRKNGKRAKDLNALLGNEFIRMGNALLRKRKRKQDAFVKGLSDKEEEEEEGGEDVEEQEEQPSKEQRYASRLRALLKSESRVFTLGET